MDTLQKKMNKNANNGSSRIKFNLCPLLQQRYYNLTITRYVQASSSCSAPVTPTGRGNGSQVDWRSKTLKHPASGAFQFPPSSPSSL